MVQLSMGSNMVFLPSEQLNRSQTRKRWGRGRQKECRERKKNIGGCDGVHVKDQRIIAQEKITDSHFWIFLGI